MKPYRRYRVTATMRGGHVLDAELYLDSVLSAVHPAMHGVDPVRRAGMEKVRHAPLPLVAAWNGNSRRCWYCSSADYPDGARLETSHFTKRRDPVDVFFASRTFQPGSGTMRDHLERRSILLAPRIQWDIASNDPKDVERLLRRVTHLGGLRRMGYGEVGAWSLEEVDGDIDQCLVQQDKAVRRIPVSMLASHAAAEPMAVMPPYWYSAERVMAVSVGTACVLRRDIDAAQ